MGERRNENGIIDSPRFTYLPCTLLVVDGNSATEFQLDPSDQDLYVPPLIWRVLNSFIPVTACAVFALAKGNGDGYSRLHEGLLEAIRRCHRQ